MITQERSGAAMRVAAQQLHWAQPYVGRRRRLYVAVGQRLSQRGVSAPSTPSWGSASPTGEAGG